MNKILCMALIAQGIAGICVGTLVAEVPDIRISLETAEHQTVENSARYRAARAEAQAAIERVTQQSAFLAPRLSLDGSYRYAATVPELSIAGPGGSSVRKLSDNHSYSLGPSLTWTVWDAGGLKAGAHSARSAAEAKQYDVEGVRRQLTLACRTAYFQASLASEQVTLYADALRLAVRQYNDVQKSARAGARSRADELSARQEVLTRQRQLSQAREDLAANMRDLAALTGTDHADSTLLPLDSRLKDQHLEGVPAATHYVTLDPLDRMQERYRSYRNARVWDNHPNIESLNRLADAARYAAESAAAGLWPRIAVNAKTSWEYPNGPTFEPFIQNAAGVSLSWALYESGASRARSNEQQSARDAALARRDQSATDFRRDWEKAQDHLAALDDQEHIAAQAAQEAEELSRIIDRSYQAGGSTRLDVENANYRFLEARTQLVRVKTQKLLYYAILASLADDKDGRGINDNDTWDGNEAR